MYIPDPTEIANTLIERQVDLVDEDMTYPCCICGRRFHIDDMFPVNGTPWSPLECGKEDCKDNIKPKNIKP